MKTRKNAMEVVANGLKFEDERVSMHSRELHPQNNANKQNANKKKTRTTQHACKKV